MSSRMVRFSCWTTLIGCVTLLVGLGWDAILHGADAHLAEHEGIFTLSNPGHALFATGIAIIVIGTALFLIARALDRSLRTGRAVYAVLLLGLLGLAAGTFAVANASGGNLLHDDHHSTTNGPDLSAATAVPGSNHTNSSGLQSDLTPAPTMADMPGMNTSASGMGGVDTATPMPSMPEMNDTTGAGTSGTPMAGMMPGMHMDSCSGLPVTDADRAAVAQLVSDVKAQAVRFTNFNAMLSEGYKQTTAYIVPGANGKWGPAHFLNMAYTTADIAAGAPINPAKPGALVYFRMPNGKMMLLGEMFIAPINKGTCLGGGLTVWHSHSNLCFKTGTQQVVGNTDAQGNCPLGANNHSTADMMHVWVFDNPDGPLAADLTKQDYTAAYQQCMNGSSWCNSSN